MPRSLLQKFEDGLTSDLTTRLLIRLLITFVYVIFLLSFGINIWHSIGSGLGGIFIKFFYLLFLLGTYPITLGSVFLVWQFSEPFLNFLILLLKHLLPFIPRFVLPDQNRIPRRSNREEEANPIPHQMPRRSNREEEYDPTPDPSKLIQILSSLFKISGYLTKNIETSQEKQEKVVQDMMNKMELEGDQKKLAQRFYRQGKRATEARIQNLASNLKDNHQKAPEILNIFMVILMEFIYLLDSTTINSMSNTMMTISRQLGLERITLDSIIELTRVRSKNIKELDRESVYRMIGISNPTVNPKMVQKVTRNLRKTYHPDALLKKGLPQEMLVFGTQLSQTFNSVYDNHIKKL